MQRNKILMATGALVVLCAAVGCTGSVSGNAANPQVPSFTSTGPVTVPSSAPPTTTEPPASSPPTEAPPNTPEPADPATASGECKAAELELSLGQGDAAAGTAYRPLRFTNKGTRTCVIQGFPGVSYVAGDHGSQVGPAAFRVGTKGAPINLAPKETAFATIGIVAVRNFDEQVCKPTSVRGLRIYPPHDTAAMFVPADGTGCAGNPPDPQLTVKTVQKGTG